MSTVWVIGGGPAGLMAAEKAADAGLPVVIADHKPSLARKFLMAGKSGLNLTMDEPDAQFRQRYIKGRDWLDPVLTAFGPQQVKAFAEGLEQEIFTGTSGRVFPMAMKASPLLRAWLRRLSHKGVETRTRWRWMGWSGDKLLFDTPDGSQEVDSAATILALGGGSWARLGSDATWQSILADVGVDLAPIQPSNVAATVPWSQHMRKHFGTPIKAIGLKAGDYRSRGEVVLTKNGLEGGGVYSITPGLRAGARLLIDLAPDLSHAEIAERLARGKPSESASNKLRKLGLPKIKQALLQECARPLPRTPEGLAEKIKTLEVTGAKTGPLDGAISTAGGVTQSAVNDGLMLNARPGTFVAGEMLDWDAPTGGYLITACLATGAWAGKAAAEWVQVSRKL